MVLLCSIENPPGILQVAFGQQEDGGWRRKRK
jgi:hypothetical protein